MSPHTIYLAAEAELPLIDRVKVLHPTRHKTGHFRDTPPRQSLA